MCSFFFEIDSNLSCRIEEGPKGPPSILVQAQFWISLIITKRESHDVSWYIFASYLLGIPAFSLQSYADCGDNLSLVILLHFVLQQFTHFQKWWYWDADDFSFLLARASNFNIKDTSPELQHKFCALWNKIVNKAQDGNDRGMAHCISRPIRSFYLALHEDTDSAPTQF